MPDDNRAAPNGQLSAPYLSADKKVFGAQNEPSPAQLHEAMCRAHGLKPAEVSKNRLELAAIRVQSGGLPLGHPEIGGLLGANEKTIRPTQVRGGRGQVPAGTTPEQRRRHVAVRAWLRFYRRLCAPGGIGVRRERGRAYVHPGDSERHPRCNPLALVNTPDSTEPDAPAPRKRLPDDLRQSPATERRLKRKADARKQLARQLGRSAGEPDPAGEKLLPLHEGRRAAPMLRSRLEMAKFLKSLPPVVRAQVRKAAQYMGEGKGRRPLSSDTSHHVVTFYAFVMYCASAPRRRRQGFTRQVEGWCREALAVSFPVNPDTGAPFDSNSLSNWVKVLEQFGLILREQPNSSTQVYRGPSGWALSVYQLRAQDDFLADAALMAALGLTASDALPQPTPSGAGPPAPS